jgi:hypothetical protein
MRFYRLLLIIMLLLIYSGCAQQVIKYEGSHIKDGKYDSEFPTQPTSVHLRNILNSVHLISSLAFYQSHNFRYKDGITKDDLQSGNLDLEAFENMIFEQPAAGTATLAYLHNNKIAFLTCAHIVNFPDTVITYYKDEENKDTDIIKTFIQKIRQINNVINQPVANNFDILLVDDEKDLAIIGKEFAREEMYSIKKEIDKRFNRPLRVLDVTLGKAEELDWGDFVYILGFPLSKKMVSRAIVSSPNYDKYHSFILDAYLQKGISGGIVLAIRDGIPNFEFVGIAKGVSGRTEYLMVPEIDDKPSAWEVLEPYRGKIFRKKHEFIEPGMTYTISIESILEFIDDHEDELKDMGYDAKLFLNRLIHQ